ncbi:unnamed protein product [Lepeophtheirus salmonis]|uniref:(salmon louse) hypothetical protein n=1 Tax=Lepeophtheirus salmonis TaxID=72036 RepID=A0A7R8CDD8_LEPSM|nr:unnamed protein product [Lepeophtheirus salmonis]CAF2778724.1 unnamed protein product [Lepeophtheirus salmonis]
MKGTYKKRTLTLTRVLGVMTENKEQVNTKIKMVFQKLISYTWNQNNSERDGDPSIVYLDGVIPPASSTPRRSGTVPSPSMNKANANLLHTILEDELENRARRRGEREKKSEKKWKEKRTLRFFIMTILNVLLSNSITAGGVCRRDEERTIDDDNAYSKSEECNNYMNDVSEYGITGDEEDRISSDGSCITINSSSSNGNSVSRKSSMESVLSNDVTMSEGEETISNQICNSNNGKDAEEDNNNSLPKDVSGEELELLKKLEEANR